MNATFAALAVVGAFTFGLSIIDPLGLTPVPQAATAKMGPQQIEQSREQQRSKQRADRYHWYPLSAEQAKRLRAALAAVPVADRRPTWVLCDGATDCRDLAQDVDTALEAAGWTSEIERPGGIVDGLHATCASLARAITSGTGIPVVVDPEESPTHCALNFGRKRGSKQ